MIGFGSRAGQSRSARDCQWSWSQAGCCPGHWSPVPGPFDPAIGASTAVPEPGRRPEGAPRSAAIAVAAAGAPPLLLALATAAGRGGRAAGAAGGSGVDGGNCNGVIAPVTRARSGLAGFEPPRGAMAAPPPLGLAGCHGRLMPCDSAPSVAGPVNDSQSPEVPWLAAFERAIARRRWNRPRNLPQG